MTSPIQFHSEILHNQKLKLHYLTLSAEDMQRLDGQFQRGRFNKRVRIRIPPIEWQAGIVALGEGKGYITLSGARMKKLGVHFGDEISFTLEPDDSKYGMEMAVEFEEVLKQDPEAKERFDQLKKSLQRYMLYYVLQVKSSEKRLERSIFLLRNLKSTPIGMEDFAKILGKESRSE